RSRHPGAGPLGAQANCRGVRRADGARLRRPRGRRAAGRRSRGAYLGARLLLAELGRELHPLVDADVELLERPALGVPVARRRLGDVVAGDLDRVLPGLGRDTVGPYVTETTT